MSGMRILIVGAAPTSLGAAIRQAALEDILFEKVFTAGITPDPHDPSNVYEDRQLDLRHSSHIDEVLADLTPDVVVCTVGVNQPTSIQSDYLRMQMADAFALNVTLPMELLRCFIRRQHAKHKTFVAISSNSARLARRGSLAYCASKAALSMALRCAARDLAGTGVRVWGYEPGLLAGTPMTKETQAAFAGNLHRMLGVAEQGLDPHALARRIIEDVGSSSQGYNGALIPFDAGEQ